MELEDQNKLITKTPFLLIGVLAVPGLGFGAFYYLIISPEGGMALAGTLSFIGLISYLFVLVFEQIIVKLFTNKMKIIWIVEILSLIALLYYFRNGIG
jgi:hypothetical protein